MPANPYDPPKETEKKRQRKNGLRWPWFVVPTVLALGAVLSGYGAIVQIHWSVFVLSQPHQEQSGKAAFNWAGVFAVGAIALALAAITMLLRSVKPTDDRSAP